MEIVVNDSGKRVEVWLTRDEKADAALRESLKPIYTKYKNMKYLVAVFESGDQDLFANTRDLLLANRHQFVSAT
ncbi:MAG: hypothetical protein LBT12_01325 [Oscillospiraceae bacterium]|nr:hypothetical protein [Oscillospiraceae bacterium]